MRLMIKDRKNLFIETKASEESKQSAYKPTRRDKRAQRELDKLKQKISDAGQVDFDELSERPLNPAEMDQSLLGIASDVLPTKDGLEDPASTRKKYTVDRESGEKTRLKANSPRKSSNTKSERKKDRSLAFWDKL